MITIAVDGVEFGDFESAGVRRAVDELVGGFQFSASIRSGNQYPIRAGQSCKVFVSGVKQINGFVEGVDVSYGEGSHTITMTGRDKSADLVDSTVGPNVDLKGPITLAGICKTTIAAMGLDIKIIDQTTGLEPFEKTEIASPEIDKSGFAFLDSFARQRQAFLTSDGAGNLVITRAGETTSVTGLKNVVGGQFNNIKTSSSSNDVSTRFNLYQVQAQLNVSAFDEDVTAADISNQSGTALDGDIRSSRRLFFQAEESADGLIAKQRAIWESNIRRARSSKYSATVAGFTQENGALWGINQLVTINDDFADIRAKMLIWSVEFSYSTQNGSTTSLVCVPPDALRLIAEEPKKQKKTDSLGDFFDE